MERYINGDKVKLLSEYSNELGEMVNFVYLEGHKKGQKGTMLSDRQKSSDDERRLQAYNDVQAGFRRLAQLAKE